MADQVNEVKQRTDIVQVISPRVEMKRAGKYWKGVCPFHAEKTPSFFVSPELQIYKCFGCGESGDVFSFLEKYEGLTFREALETLAEKAGVKLEAYRPSGNERETQQLYEILNLAGEYYEYILNQHKAGSEGRKYLDRRGVDEGLRQKFGLGWAPTAWDSIYRYLVAKKKYTPELVEKTGLIIKSNQGGRYYDRFRARVMFPLADFRGRTVGFSGRLIEEGVKEAKYINTPETAIYRKRELLYGIEQTRGVIRKKDRVLVMEGELDVLSSYRAGVMNVVAIKGSALTEEQLRLVMRLTRNVALCLDADSAGDEATKRGITLADKMGMNVEVIEVVGGKDPDEVVRSDPKLWRKQTKKGVSVYDYFIGSAFGKFDAKTGPGKKRISEELSPVLSAITNSVEQAHYVKKVAEGLGVGEEVLQAEMEKMVKKEKVGGESRKEAVEIKQENREEKLERYVWGLFMQVTKERFGEAWKKIKKIEWVTPGFGRLTNAMEKYLAKSEGGFEVEELVQELPEELAGLLSQVYLNQDMVKMGGEEEWWRDFEEAVDELIKLSVKRGMKTISDKMAELERKGKLNDEEKRELSSLQHEFAQLVVDLRR